MNCYLHRVQLVIDSTEDVERGIDVRQELAFRRQGRPWSIEAEVDGDVGHPLESLVHRLDPFPDAFEVLELPGEGCREGEHEHDEGRKAHYEWVADQAKKRRMRRRRRNQRGRMKDGEETATRTSNFIYPRAIGDPER